MLQVVDSNFVREGCGISIKEVLVKTVYSACLFYFESGGYIYIYKNHDIDSTKDNIYIYIMVLILQKTKGLGGVVIRVLASNL